jgi:ferredoxin-NADP reductase
MPEWLKKIVRPIYFRVLHWRGNPGINMQGFTIEEIVREYGDVYSFVLKGDDKTEFVAGQYTHLIAPGAIRDHNHVRHMSFANAPHEDFTIFSMDVSSGSRFKRRFSRASVGDRVKLFKIKGAFVFDPARNIGQPEQPVLFIAGGIGITPIRSLISDLEHRGCGNWSLVYAGRDYLYRDFWPQFGERVLLTGRDRLLDDLRTAIAGIEKTVPVYLCGSDDFVANVQAWLMQNGVASDLIHIENFDH